MRVLLCNAFKPFTIPNEYNAPDNLVEHGLIHRSFTRRQGMFTIDQTCYSYPLHLMAHNISAETTVLEFPSVEEFTAEVDRGYDFVGIGMGAPTLNKARRMCEIVKERAPGTKTIVGGGGVMAIGEVVAPFSDYICPGEGVGYLRELLGDAPGPVRFPIISSVKGPNTILGLPAHNTNFVVAVGMGCRRKCDFCSTSHQFGGKYIPLFNSGRELFQFMKKVERHEARQGRHHEALSFLIYDENFLMNRPLVDEFRALNREQLLNGPQYLTFVFTDAKTLSGYSVEELLEIGVDSVWVGLESPSVAKYQKLKGVDVKGLIDELTSSGIKIFTSMIAGLEDHDEALIRQDIEFALGLSHTAVQYAPVNPLPGTPYYRRLKEQNRIPDRSLNYLSMSHFNVLHPRLDEETVLRLIEEYLDRDYMENGPMVYRFLKGRWQGYLRHRWNANPYARARTRIYARDLLRGYPVMLIGEVYGPTARTRDLFRKLRREVQQHFEWPEVFKKLRGGQLSMNDGGIYLATSPPLLRDLARYLLVLNVLLRDPRTGGIKALMDDWKGALKRSQRGTVPWEQPATIRTAYPAGMFQQPATELR